MWVLMKLLAVAALVVVMRSPSGTNALTCGDAISALIPCGPFLLGSAAAPEPNAQCCSNVQSLNEQARDTATRRALCQCLKQSGPSYGVKPDRARLLPSDCKITLQIPISPNVDCSR
ncbi:hypothetical protein Scep_012694 [Stephania cephalantha]|uniref:Non-specific lipid-transfer protein n=1 Tax=Stephania cephalantha TaxID=152367 RepID=A0AAP0PA35_9MAGN